LTYQAIKKTVNNLTANIMEREEFLSKLGIGVLALCTGCGIASCSTNAAKSGDPTPNVNPPTSGTVFTADLNSEVTAVGASKIASGVILVRLAAGNAASAFTAVQVACTHEGTTIGYNTGASRFICPLHGSQFSQTGQVLVGPALVSLKKYTVSISGTTLTVTA
jgi:cytochrome b6-f complex iron-sulfur subunit